MKIFSRKLYFSITLVLILLVAGFLLMAGPEKVQGEFSEEMFSFRRITLAPVIILSAYGLLIFVIFKKN
ncbi:DUF3098 domain-containing protein [Tangfeifania diversioriginum]|uniref:DUF3098 domain-containing protein n=1 Tax=Tangfeifania diversioriginum TaxID=1168035 RepID=UPI00093232A3